MYRQRGSVLVVSLIFVVLMSLIAVSGMQLSSLEERMAGNHQDKDRAFQAAEAALVEGEQFVLTTDFDREVHFKKACSGSLCFDDSCAGGLCLTGRITSGCEIRDTENEPWLEDDSNQYSFPLTDGNDGAGDLINVWTTTGKHRTATQGLNSVTSSAKYIVEFICFTQKDPDAPAPDAYPNDSAEWSEMYRITALATGAQSTNKVMLQSTFKKD
ncbi:PilX N-terminal domain-containing pilus assembly protein [Amphritea sp. 1_MG-2023]|uniref:pilus assembly PilX family protein n=1 Tax=Amphritea sp. 1_MG-2023 TaxID=3062670 RepID=UPI0026E380A8|nr:PilX N-terminal domain-containing pilus assembly protein [Amphritea sp. 1_MG-2023]MDO6563629.1 PilX N-terminal domain-containing pilus assembly protein [Amphritea sp. 1_MG-2023]